jgi:hypothetical protein
VDRIGSGLWSSFYLSKMVAADEITRVNKLTIDQTKQRGVREALLVVVAAALMFSPTFIARSLYRRIGGDISVIAIMALAIFLVGTFILLKVVKE